jgi:hypothetical protein
VDKQTIMNRDIKVGDKVKFRSKVWIVVLEGIDQKEMLIANHKDLYTDGYIDYWVGIRDLKLIDKL